MKRVSNDNLTILIDGLRDYKDRLGVIDPWVLSTGEKIEPLDVLEELRELREEKKTLKNKITDYLRKLCWFNEDIDYLLKAVKLKK